MSESRTSFDLVAVGALTAVALNVLMGVGILFASQFRGDVMAAEAEASQAQPYMCRFIEGGRFHRVEVDASDWQSAEEQVCGASFRGVRVPPRIAVGYGALIASPERDRVLLAQRESCSCSDKDVPPILEDIGIVEPPRLGTLPKRNALPQIVNNPTPAERNALNPNLKASEPSKREKKKERKRDPDLTKLRDVSSNFDPARPANDREAVGSPDGSRFSTSATGQGDPYLQKVKARLDNSMNAPSSIPKSQLKSMKAKIWIKIGDSGAVLGWDFLRKSKNAAFDSMVERSIERFSLGGEKFPPPPPEWKFKRITVYVDGGRIK